MTDTIYNLPGSLVTYDITSTSETTGAMTSTSVTTKSIVINGSTLGATGVPFIVYGGVDGITTPAQDNTASAVYCAGPSLWNYPYMRFQVAEGTVSAPTKLMHYTRTCGSLSFYAQAADGNWDYAQVVAGVQGICVVPAGLSGLYSSGELDFVVYDNGGNLLMPITMSGWDHKIHFNMNVDVDTHNVTTTGTIDAGSYKAGGTSPVADGTYTMGAKLTTGGTNGTITTKGGIITAITQAT
jgi:hypothetical protein